MKRKWRCEAAEMFSSTRENCQVHSNSLSFKVLNWIYRSVKFTFSKPLSLPVFTVPPPMRGSALQPPLWPCCSAVMGGHVVLQTRCHPHAHMNARLRHHTFALIHSPHNLSLPKFGDGAIPHRGWWTQVSLTIGIIHVHKWIIHHLIEDMMFHLHQSSVTFWMMNTGVVTARG